MKYCMGCMEAIDDSVIVCHHCGYNNDVNAAAPIFIKPGSILANRYIVGKNLSYDKTTALYIAQDAYESCKVLIKEFLPEKYVNCRNKDTGDVLVMSPQYEAFDKERNAFLFHEKKVKSVVENDAVLKCLEVVEDMNTVYAVCSYAGVTTLTEHIRRNGKYSEEGAITALMGVMRGVDKLHENDIKLGNITTDSIFVTENGELKLWKYEPTWGHSSKAADAAKFGKKKVIPLNEYAAPEILDSVDQITIRSDVYSIAAVLYDMMCGTPPASAARRLKRFNKKGRDVLKSPKKFIRDIKPDHENALLNALAIAPDNRTKDIECLISELTSGVTIKRIKEKSGLPFFSKIPLFVKLLVPLVFVAAIVLGQVYVHRKSDIIKPEGIAPVPDVVSWDSGIAANQLKRKGFTMQVTGVTPTDQETTGTVMTQEPASGSLMPLNTPVYVTVAKYSDMIDMPFVRGGDAEEAKKRLEAMGFTVKIEEAKDDVIVKGCVITQEPAAIVDGKYNRVPYGCEVTLTKSSGRANQPQYTAIPVLNYTGKSFDEAYEMAKETHGALLKVKEFRFTEEPITKVLEQDPASQSDSLSVEVPIELVVSKGYNEFDMPDLTYMTKEQAEGLLSEYSMQITFDEEPTPSVSAGLIFKQSIPSGFKTKPCSEIRLTVSTGAEQVNMINVVGMTKNDAIKALGEVGLGAEVSYKHSDRQDDEDKVLEQDPKQGTSVVKGSKVSITVSTGAELVQVPDVLNKPENEAKKILTDAGFKVDSQQGKGSATVGSVMSQSPESGQTLKKGETVSIVVCSGESPTTTTTVPTTTTTPEPSTTTTTTPKEEVGYTTWFDSHIKAMRIQTGHSGSGGQNAFIVDDKDYVPADLGIVVKGSDLGNYWQDPDQYIFSFVYNEDHTAVYLAAYYGNSSYVDVPDSIYGDDGKYIPVIGVGEQAFTLKADLVTTIKLHSIKSVQYEIGRLAFAECKALVSVELPDTTVSIGNGAFMGCSALPTLVIPESVTEIGDSAFADCVSLSTITIPSQVKVIEDAVFKGCKSLINITLPAGLTAIEAHAFQGCASLKTLLLPSNSVKVEPFSVGCDEDGEPYPGFELKLPDGTSVKPDWLK